MKKATAILVADIHLEEKAPISRTDDYIKTQETKLKFLADLQLEHHGCPILCSGDVFEYWRASPWLCSWAINHLPRTPQIEGTPNSSFITIPGNHDLPQHSMDEYSRSALYVLEAAKVCTVLKGEHLDRQQMIVMGIPFGQMDKFQGSIYTHIPQDIHKNIHIHGEKKKKVLMLHELIFPDEKPFWAEHGYTAKEILETFPEFDLILTGDNHQSFTREMDGRVLVNPGSMLRRTAAQQDFKPVAYLYYADTNSVEPVPFPVEPEVHNIEHIVKEKERDVRVSAYIERIKDNWDVGLSFKDNLLAFFEKNNTSKRVREIIWEHLETEMN